MPNFVGYYHVFNLVSNLYHLTCSVDWRMAEGTRRCQFIFNQHLDRSQMKRFVQFRDITSSFHDTWPNEEFFALHVCFWCFMLQGQQLKQYLGSRCTRKSLFYKSWKKSQYTPLIYKYVPVEFWWLHFYIETLNLLCTVYQLLWNKCLHRQMVTKTESASKKIRRYSNTVNFLWYSSEYIFVDVL